MPTTDEERTQWTKRPGVWLTSAALALWGVVGCSRGGQAPPVSEALGPNGANASTTPTEMETAP